MQMGCLCGILFYIVLIANEHRMQL